MYLDIEKYIEARKAMVSKKIALLYAFGIVPVIPLGDIPVEKTVTGNPVTITDALAQDALSLQVSFTPTQDGTPSIDSEPTTEPYLSKVIPRGNKEYYSLTGGTVAWNQLTKNDRNTEVATGGITFTANGDGSFTADGTASANCYFYSDYISSNKIQKNHVYYYRGCPSGGSMATYRLGLTKDGSSVQSEVGNGNIFKNTSDIEGYISTVIYIYRGYTANNLIFKPQIFDLTLMFGSTIADYIASLEQATAGSGIAWLKSYGFFTEGYYPYNAGELISVNTSGHKIGSTTYPIDPTDLRGLFKLSNGKLYCEGDIYKPDGTVTRKYSEPIDLGTLTWTYAILSTGSFFYANLTGGSRADTSIGIMNGSVYTQGNKSVNKQYGIYGSYLYGGFCRIGIRDDSYVSEGVADATAFKNSLSGTYLVYPLETPTTESATPYTSPIDVEAGGTEEFIDNRTVPIPVGNETYYASEYEIHGKTGITVSHGATEDDPNPTEYEVEFTQQGTVYGGTVDIVSGVLTVVNKHFTFNSIEYYGTYGSDNAPLYYADIPNYATEPVKKHPSVSSEGLLLSNIFAPISTEYLVNMQNYEIRISDAALPSRFYMRVDGQNPVSASNPLEIVAELQTPQTYQLTTQQVQMLLNNNYLTTSDGTITLTYLGNHRESNTRSTKKFLRSTKKSTQKVKKLLTF